MISDVAQTLGRILADGTSVENPEAISFNFPRTGKGDYFQFVLYFYKIQPIHPEREKSQLFKPRKPFDSNQSGILWFDIFFLLSAEDRTALGKQRLLSEALGVLLRHKWLEEQLLAPTLKGCGSLPLMIHQPEDLTSLWQVLEVPYRPALYLSVTAPLRLNSSRIDAPLKLAS